jgi:hypothetical protein
MLSGSTYEQLCCPVFSLLKYKRHLAAALTFLLNRRPSNKAISAKLRSKCAAVGALQGVGVSLLAIKIWDRELSLVGAKKMSLSRAVLLE